MCGYQRNSKKDLLPGEGNNKAFVLRQIDLCLEVIGSRSRSSSSVGVGLSVGVVVVE